MINPIDNVFEWFIQFWNLLPYPCTSFVSVSLALAVTIGVIRVLSDV